MTGKVRNWSWREKNEQKIEREKGWIRKEARQRDRQRILFKEEKDLR